MSLAAGTDGTVVRILVRYAKSEGSNPDFLATFFFFLEQVKS